MKNKILTILLIALSILCLFSCGGDEDDNDENQLIINCHNGEEVTSNNIASATGNYIAPAQKTGHSFLGYYTQEGTQYFDSEGNQASGLIIESDLDLYAKFEPYTFTIELNSQTGYFEDGATQKTVAIKYGESLEGKLLYVLSATPKYEFDGWFNENGSIKYSDNVSFDGYENNAIIKMYAQFKLRELTVTLNYNDGLTLPDTIKIKYGEAIGDLSSYTLDNGSEEITGWSSSSYYEAPLPEGVTEDLHIYAVWTEYKNVDFVYPKEQIVSVKIYKKQGESSILPSEELPGYDFQGWYANEILSGNPVENVPYGALASKYYGKWEQISYTLTFNSDEYEAITYHYGDTTKLPTPSKEGHNFGGWLTETGECFYSIPATLYGNYTLTAKWTPIVYSIGLDAQGGTVKKNYATIEYGSTFTVEAPKRTGYEFLGWYDDSELGQQITDKNGNSFGIWQNTTQINLYAKWEMIDYTITFDDETIEPIIYNYGDTVQLPTPQKENYIFQGWKLKSDSTLYYEITADMLGDISFYAKWLHKDEAAVVSFEANGGTEIPNQVYKKGDKLSLPTNVTKEGLYFEGWYNETMDTEYKNGIVLNENITLYAKWIESTPISSVEDLNKIRENPSKNYHLTKDINFKFEAWTPISEFSGILNGQGFKISNMVLNGNQVQYLGFINKNNGTVKNLSFENVSFKISTNIDESQAAIIVARNEATGKIINCHTLSGSIEYYAEADRYIDSAKYDDINVGNISGRNEGLISGCTARVNISGMQASTAVKGHACIGGLVGGIYGKGVVTACSAELSIVASGEARGRTVYFRIGGLIGEMRGESCRIEKSYANCSITLDYNRSSGVNNGNCGGLIGHLNSGTITESYSNGSIYSSCHDSTNNTGGFVGYMEQNTGAVISNCYADVAVQGVGHNMTHRLGAFAGYIGGAVSNCYALGSINNWNGPTGTWAGYISSTGSVKGCFTSLTSAFDGGCDGIKVNNANANDYTLEELKSADFLYNTLYFDEEIWIADGENWPILAWQAENEERGIK